MSPPSLQDSLPAGWLSLYREGVEPSGSLQKVSDHPSSFSGLSLAQGKFHFEPPFTSFDHLVGSGEQRRRHHGTADCCIHPPGRNEMIAITPPKIFSKEVAQKQATPFPRQDLLTTRNRF